MHIDAQVIAKSGKNLCLFEYQNHVNGFGFASLEAQELEQEMCTPMHIVCSEILITPDVKR